MKDIIVRYTQSNIKEIILIITIMFIGMIIGVLCINNISSENENNIKTYLNDMISEMKKIDNYKEVNQVNILNNNLKNNILYILIIGILSASVLGIFIVYILLLIKGFSIGYSMSAIMATFGTKKGIIFICSSMILHNIIYIIGILLVSINGINLYNYILHNERTEIKIKIIRHIVFIIIAILFGIISAIFETYISNTIFFMIRHYM